MFGKLEPSEEIEWLARAQVAAVMETARDGGQILEAGRGVMGSLFKYRAAFILSHRPPRGVFPNGNERGTIRFGTTQPGLLRHELILLPPRDVAFVAGDSPQRPSRTLGQGGDRSADKVQFLHGGQGGSGNGLRFDRIPRPRFSANKGKESWIHHRGFRIMLRRWFGAPRAVSDGEAAAECAVQEMTSSHAAIMSPRVAAGETLGVVTGGPAR